jgi:hypothetical protein
MKVRSADFELMRVVRQTEKHNVEFTELIRERKQELCS